MKKAKKLFKSPSKSPSKGVNGHSSFSPAAASALSLSPVVEADNDDFNKAFRGMSSDADRRVNDSLHQNQSERRGGEYDIGSVRRHPHEVDREADADASKSYDDGRRRRALRQKEQSRRKQGDGGYSTVTKERTRKHSGADEVNGKYDAASRQAESSRNRRETSAPAPDDYSEYSSQQKKTIDNYVQSVIANAGSDEYVTPLPRMDSGPNNGSSGFFSETSSEGGTEPPHTDKNLLPIPGFGEVDLLQRAIQRRELLHDRITKMEAASAEFAREEDRRELGRQRKKSAERKGGSADESHDRMNQISKRIKAEALEFLNYDHVTDEASDNVTDDASNSTKEPSENEGIDPPEEYTLSQQRQNQKGGSSIDEGPTSHQLARYANMVKLGIPESAILRSMERDGIDTSRGNVILERLKNQTGIKAAPSDEVLEEKKPTAPKQESIFDSPISLRSLITEIRESPKPKIRKDSLPPLKDDPDYNKYFKMIKAKVPLSWVKRVLEVDGKDARVLDLDPDRPLTEQIAGAGVDEHGNVDWSKVSIFRVGSDRSVESSGDELMGKSSKHKTTPRKKQSSDIYNETAANVKAELAIMTAKAGRLSRDSSRSRQSSYSGSSNDAKEQGPSHGDISSEAAAASNARLNRLKAMATPDRSTLRRKQSVDEIRRRPPPPPPRTPKPSNQITSPPVSGNSAASIERAVVSSRRQTYKDVPLKDDPRFSKYFQMIRSRVPRSWVERVIEVDDRDPAILDLDPNKPLAAQVDELSKNAALEAMFAKRALAEDKSPPILRDDPEYQKYFKMLKVGMPRPTVEQALERDGKSISILDLDPERPLAEQQKEEKPKQNSVLEALFANRAAALQPPKQTDVPLKLDPVFQKYFKMLKVGMPRDSVVQALERDGKSASILDLDPEKSYASQTATAVETGGEETKSDVLLKDDPEYSKFFKMLKMGIPLGAVEQALQKEGKDKRIASMDPNKSYASQIKEEEEEATSKADAAPLKDDPEYSKFFKMLKMGIPLPAVKQALVKEDKDPNIIDMDPDKPLAKAVPLKDDEEYSKFFKMLKMGIPLPAVKQALVKEGKDPNIIDMDPDKPLSQQQQSKQIASKKLAKASNGPKVARKRLHWNKIDESKLNEKSFWNQAKDEHASLQLVGLDIDNEEFASLFTSQVNKTAAPKKDPSADVKKSSSKQKVQLIDGRRRMNGSILLTKFKVNYKLLAKQVDNMEYVKAEGNELRGMMQLLPTKDESLALRSYLPPVDAPQSEIDEAIDKLGECEQYMAVMLDVPDAKEKFQCMLFRAEFEQQVDNIRDGTKLLIDACNSVQNSERFKKLLMYALKLGNALNTDGSSAEATAITLDSLLKLAEAKAFDRQTSVLHYLVSIVSKNDEDVLLISEDFIPVKAAERVAVDMLSQQLNELTKGIELIKVMAKKYARQSETTVDKESEEVTPEDELLSATPMGKFSLSAESKITSLTKEFAEAKVNFADLLEFFGEDSNLTPEAFFCTINTFISMFDQTYKELKRKEEAKERKMRIDEKLRLREEAAKQAKSKS